MGIYQATPGGIIRSVNPALAQMCGYESPEDLMANVTDFRRQLTVDPNERPETRRLADDHGSVSGLEQRILRKDGSAIWISATFRSVRDENGSLLYYEGFLSDITDRKQAEQLIVESEQRFRSLMENAADAIYLMDPQLIFVDVNPAGCELSGYTRTELLTMAANELLEGVTPEEIYEARDRTEPNAPPKAERLLRRKDGSTVPIENRVNRIELGETSYYLAVTRDIAERKVAERELQNREMHYRQMDEIGRIISSSLDIESVYEEFSQAVSSLIPFDLLNVVSVNLDRGELTGKYQLGLDISGRETGVTISLVGTASGEAARKGTSLLLQMKDRTEVEARYPGLLPAFDAGLQTFMIVPLISNGRVIGVLQLGSTQAEAYDEGTLMLAESVASQIGGAIANSQLHVEHQRLAEENSVMAKIGRIISSSLDIDDVYDALGIEIQKMIPCDRIYLNLVDLERGVRSTIWVTGDVVRGGAEGDELPLEGSIAAEAVHTRWPIMLDTDSDSDLLLRYPLLSSSIYVGFRAFLGVPLISRDTVIGVLRAQSKSLRAY